MSTATQSEQLFFDVIVEFLEELGVFGDAARARANDVLSDADERANFLKYFNLTEVGENAVHS